VCVCLCVCVCMCVCVCTCVCVCSSVWLSACGCICGSVVFLLHHEMAEEIITRTAIAKASVSTIALSRGIMQSRR